MLKVIGVSSSANVQSLFQVMEPGLLDQNVCHYPANHSARIRTRPYM